jgi:hypothetical protein
MLGKRDQLFDVGTQFLRLGQGGGDLFVLDQGGGQVAQQRNTVSRSTTQLTLAQLMTHNSFSVRRGAVSGTPIQAELTGSPFPFVQKPARHWGAPVSAKRREA